jgi:hypothetical protein
MSAALRALGDDVAAGLWQADKAKSRKRTISALIVLVVDTKFGKTSLEQRKLQTH